MHIGIMAAACAAALAACGVPVMAPEPLQSSAPAPAPPTALAQALATQGRYAEAVALLEAEAGRHPSAALLGNLGYAYYLDGRLLPALGALERACLLEPGNAVAWERLAALLETVGESGRGAGQCGGAGRDDDVDAATGIAGHPAAGAGDGGWAGAGSVAGRDGARRGAPGRRRLGRGGARGAAAATGRSPGAASSPPGRAAASTDTRPTVRATGGAAAQAARRAARRIGGGRTRGRARHQARGQQWQRRTRHGGGRGAAPARGGRAGGAPDEHHPFQCRANAGRSPQQRRTATAHRAGARPGAGRTGNKKAAC